MKIVPVRALSDNYIWLLVDGSHAAAVDPGDAIPVIDYLERHDLILCSILITHRHHDHIGGVDALLRHRYAAVYAPAHAPFDFPHHQVREGDKVTLPELETTLDVLEVPGHTHEHVAYYVGNSLLCGDTLFGCGCGRIFEGNCVQLHRSLQKLAALPDHTNLYPAHEYTLDNIAFARSIDPENTALIERQEYDGARIAQGLPTLPSTLALEKATNPFLRCNTPAIRQAASKINPRAAASEETTFCAIRELKNHY